MRVRPPCHPPAPPRVSCSPGLLLPPPAVSPAPEGTPGPGGTDPARRQPLCPARGESGGRTGTEGFVGPQPRGGGGTAALGIVGAAPSFGNIPPTSNPSQQRGRAEKPRVWDKGGNGAAEGRAGTAPAVPHRPLYPSPSKSRECCFPHSRSPARFIHTRKH